MSYSVETFNRYKELCDKSRSAVSREIQYLLNGDTQPKYGENDAKLKSLYNEWRADARAMDAACEKYWHIDAAMIVMPPNDAKHLLCRRMAAINIEREVYGEFVGQKFLPNIVADIRADLANSATHPESCACNYTAGWTYNNLNMLNDLKQAKIDYKASKPSKPSKSIPLTTPLLDDDFVKGLFKSVQGVEYDSKCPHGLPFYACMSCSH